MSGKARVSLEAIIDSALAIIRESGWEAVSARSLAERLQSSTMPIYSSAGSMEDLKGLARGACLKILEGYQGRSYSGEALMDKAIGYIAFAKAEGQLFRFLFDSRGQAPTRMDAVKEKTARDAETDPDFTAAFGSMPREGVAAVGFHTWVYVHGLSCLLADGLLELGDDEVLRCLETAGGAFFTHISNGGG
jgi:AcrR family transcriptional regulator